MLFEACAQNAGLGEVPLMQLIGIKAEKARVPFNVHFELTYRCNEQCIHCYCVVEHGQEEEAKKRELTYEEVVRVLDELAELGALYVTFSGGEVLVRSDFFDIVEHARRRGFVYRIYTNGIGLTEERIRRLAALEPLTVELSVLSADPAEHDRITRVPGSFRRLMKNVRRLKEHGLRVYLKTTVMKPNFKGLVAVRQLGRDLEVFHHTFSCEVSPRINGEIRHPLQYQLDEEELVQYMASDAWQKEPQPLPPGPPEEVAKQRQTCGPAVNGCCIDPYGNVFPCVAFRIPIGNVREQPFKDLWYAPPPPIKKLLSVQTYADLPECRSCELVGFCSRCHGDNLLERGGDWEACHERARKVASAERRVYQELQVRQEGGQ
jgi:radical SAM protein with 4Fe4S-binding SPASM domain